MYYCVCCSGAYRLQDVIASANPETLTTIRELQAMIRHDEPCAIQFTSVRFRSCFNKMNYEFQPTADHEVPQGM